MFNLPSSQKQMTQPQTFSNFFDLFNQMENMMTSSFQTNFNIAQNSSFIDQGATYVFTIQLEHVSRDNIHLVIENDLLILTIQQQLQTNQQEVQSFQSSSFSQTFNVSDVETDQITATLKNDTLTIVFPKKATMVVNRRIIPVL